jgi:diacylglycerol kinase family enzyme
MERAKLVAVENAGPIFVIVNASSGRNAAEDKIELLRAGFSRANRPYEILVAEHGGQIAEVARRAVDEARQRRGVLAVAGGDGTINAVGQVALAHEIAFGIIPEGTFNYLSRSHGIPQEPEEAIRSIIGGVVRPVQAGMVNDRVFFVNASVGLYPQLLEDREAYKRRFGRSRYVAVWSALVTLMSQAVQLEIDLEADDQRRHVRTPTLFVANNRLQLEQVGIAEAPSLDHDHLVAITAQSLGIVSSLRLMARGFMGRLGEAPEVSSFAFETLAVQIGRRRRPSRVKVATDGEIVYLATPLTFRPSPHRLQLIVPAEPASASSDSQSSAAISGAAAA